MTDKPESAAPPGIKYSRNKNPQRPAEPGKRAASRRHPLLQGRPRNVWHGDIAHLMPGYPKTQEKFDAMRERAKVIMANNLASGAMKKRICVPQGYGRRPKELLAVREAAAVKAQEIMTIMKEQGIIDPAVTTDEQRAETALGLAVEMVIAKNEAGHYAYGTRERLGAIQTVLAYTKAKPAAKIEASVTKAEDFLLGLSSVR